MGQGFAGALSQRARDLPVIGSQEQVIEVLRKSEGDDVASLARSAKALEPTIVAIVMGSGPGIGEPAAERVPDLVEEEPSTGGGADTEERPEREGVDSDAGGSAEEQERIEYEAVVAELRQRVRGQDEAVDLVARRLAVTRAGLDLRPERPDGVFLFVGPTGVGKTELAIALAAVLMNDETALIRLDMTEYAHDWALSRLTGPMPGYVGSNEPDAWLTTKVAKKPRSVVLLDEVEKAHPAVWSVFLQAFDAGRLTDSRGTTADFSKTIFIMTSNIGASVFTSAPVGFVRSADTDDDALVEEESRSVRSSVSSFLPPELVNRLDAVVTFKALSAEDIQEIAELEIAQLCERMRQRGIDLKVDSGARKLLAETNYDRRYGARHLHRNLEGMLIEPLALSGITEGKVKVIAKDGQIHCAAD